MKTAANWGLLKTIYSTFRSAFRYLMGQTEGPPKLPPELERQIFETCAFDCPEVCANLVLVCKRVYIWSVGALYSIALPAYNRYRL